MVGDEECRCWLAEIQQARHVDVSLALRCLEPEFGLRLLLAIVYVARRQATEGQIWPAVRAGLHLSASVADLLFHSNGQPRSEVKNVIEKCCRQFNLRHVFGQDGAQEWFGSIYLQFGFTKRGFDKMLPEWMMGYNQPNTIERLLDDPSLCSESFKRLWFALIAYRRGNITESQATRLINDCPWVLEEWAPDLLLAARKRLHLSEAHRDAGDATTVRSFLSEPILLVDGILENAVWQVRFEQLADLSLVGKSFVVRLSCDDLPLREVVLQRQADGSLSNLDHTFEFSHRQVTQGRARAAILDAQGSEVAAQDIRFFDQDADIVAFNDRGSMVADFLNRGPRPGMLYHLLIRDDLSIDPPSSEWWTFEKSGYKLHRIRFSAGCLTRVLFDDGEELWSSESRTLQGECPLPPGVKPRIVITDTSDRIHDPALTSLSLRVDGLDDAMILGARWRSVKLQHQSPSASNCGWILTGLPKIDAALARTLQIQLRLRRGDVTFRTTVVWETRFTGICEQSRGRTSFGEFFSTRNLEQLKRGRYAILPKALSLEQTDRGISWCMFEGDRFISPLREGASHPILNLGGYGQNISIRLGRFNCEEKPCVLIGEVADKGLFHIYDVNPFLGRDYTFDAWASPDLSEEFRLHYGMMNGKSTTEPATSRLVFMDDKAMFSPFPDVSCDYLVLSFEGVRLATWWRVPNDGSSWSSSLAEVRDDVDARRAAFTIRWAKLPILSRHHYQDVKRFFLRFSHVVLGAWLNEPKMRTDGKRIESENTEAWHDAVRAVIQGYQVAHAETTDEQRFKLLECVTSDGCTERNARVCDTLKAVGHCDPLLMGRMISHWASTTDAHNNRKNMRGLLLQHEPDEDDLNEQLRVLTPQVSDDFFQKLLAAAVRAVSDPALDDTNKNNLKAALTIRPFRQLLYRNVINHCLRT